MTDTPDNPIICACLEISKNDVIQGIKENDCKTIEDVVDAIGIGAVCGACLDDIQEILDEVNGED
ncbi:MAG: hypothetical protein BGO29_04275 [Bacteroidales bacterium 36-12]|nr:MAG: hypothetical protein BGO29_04275 [Bacteroidales bacterium 36-12]